MPKLKRKNRGKPATREDVARLRQGLVALCRAVAALGHRLTGDEMSVRIDLDDGQHVWSTPKVDGVRWSPPLQLQELKQQAEHLQKAAASL